MSEIAMLQGKIRIVGMVHGALNTIVILDAYPDDWEFKQFVDEEQLYAFARENNLAVIQKEKS